MPLSDYINFRPAPEVTGGLTGLGVTADELAQANRAVDFQTAANTWATQVGPQPGVDLNAAAAALAAGDRITLGASGLPTNIFQGPVTNVGLAGLPANAIYNLASYGLNALSNAGYNQVALSGLPQGGNVAGNISLPGLSQGGDLSGANVDIASLLASQGQGGASILGLTPYNPNMGSFGQASVENLVQNALARNAPVSQPATTVSGSDDVFPSDSTGGMTSGNPFVVEGTRISDVSFNPPTGVPAGVSSGGIDLSGVGGGGTMGPTALPAVRVSDTTLDQPQITPTNLGIGSSAGIVGGLGNMTGGGVSTLPAVNVTASQPSTAQPQSIYSTLIDQYKAAGLDQPTQLPPVIVTPSGSNVSVTPTLPSNQLISVPNLGITGMGPFSFTPTTSTTTATTTSQTTATTSQTTTTAVNTGAGTGGITFNPNAGTVAAGTGRNFAAELAASRAALQGEQANLMNMYGGIYQNLLGQTAIPEAAQRSLEQARLDQAKLQRVQSGQLAAEDIRQAQQAAREAYGARGQVMGQPAIGAEILNREAIRQQREDQARAGYQASMGNVFNAANLQTGNIFQPIGNLVGQTFNPLGAYPQDVYSSNFNAQLARDIAAANNQAAIEAAKYGAQASRQAATTSGIFNIAAAGVKGYLSCMPGSQTIDTPNGPVAIECLKAGDEVVGYDGKIAVILQHSSYTQDPARAFIRFTLQDGRSFVVCDVHKIRGIPAKEWAVGADMGGQAVKSMDVVKGISVSYDILTTAGGYQINGIAVNSMIPEMMRLFNELVKEVA